MASKVCKVVPDGKNFRTHIRTRYKRGKITLKEYRKYQLDSSAKSDHRQKDLELILIMEKVQRDSTRNSIRENLNTP